MEPLSLPARTLPLSESSVEKMEAKLNFPSKQVVQSEEWLKLRESMDRQYLESLRQTKFTDFMEEEIQIIWER
jgi:hypothetical protein